MSRRLPGRASAQIEADRRLLQYTSYEDYLITLTTLQDECYLQSRQISLTVAELGYRCSGETLSREQFEKRLAAVLLYLYPPYRPYESSSEGLTFGDQLQKDLALRERGNRVGILSTIIFVRYYTSGCEISGYMDYGEKLTTTDWKPFFRGEKRIPVRDTDMGYYNWKKGKVVSNDSLNYKVLQDPISGLMFRNRFDRKLINPAPDSEDAGQNTKRKRVQSTMYELAILFDHVVRQRI